MPAIGRNRTAQQGRLELSLTGDAELLAAMQEITSSMVDKIAPAGIRGYMRVMAKSAKAEIPGRYKHARKAVGWRFVKRDKRNRGQVTAKVGAGVGISKARRATMAEQAKNSRKKGTGVGLSVQNIHWAVEGTSHRQRKTAGPTGRMPAIFDGFLATAYRKGRSEALSKFRELTAAAIAKEARKIRAKARTQARSKANRFAKRTLSQAVRRAL